jgi:hypothetical protein
MVGVTDPGISRAWLGEVLILSEFIWEYSSVHLQKKILRNTPARSETGFGILGEFMSITDL